MGVNILHRNLIVVKSKPFPKQTILDSSDLKEFADDNFKFVKNRRKLFKRGGGEREIPQYEHFLLCPQCFRKTVLQIHNRGGLVWERVNPLPHNTVFDAIKIYSCGKHCEKIRNCL